MKLLTTLLLLLSTWGSLLSGQMLDMLAPDATATHTATSSGSWFDPAIWSTGTVPSDGAIVVIPMGVQVTYQGSSKAHIFILKVNGTFEMVQYATSGLSELIVDTFLGNMMSTVRFTAGAINDGEISVKFAPFDIELYKSAAQPMIWNDDAVNHYSDGSEVTKYSRKFQGKKRYNTYEQAVAGNAEIVSTEIGTVDDGAGVLGRYSWDPQQLSLGMVNMGQTEVLGKEKKVMLKLAQDAPKGQKLIHLQSEPTGWAVGDTIIVSRGGNHDTPTNGHDLAVIDQINGTVITTQRNLKKNHFGSPHDTLHCYVGNLIRNITFESANTQTTNRGHVMFMHNDTNISIQNAAFRNLGRTNKSELVDDLLWDHWVEPKVATSKLSPLGQEVAVALPPPVNEITNHRGRYSIHLHKTGVTATSNPALIKGNSVWGNIGWAITQHDSYANIEDNVIYQVTGAAIVSETGSELGNWDRNLVIDIDLGHNTDVYEAVLGFDEYLFSGQGLAMKGRGVMCHDNVIVDANQGVGIMNMTPLVNSTDRVDPKALATFRPGFEIDQFPLDVNGYSKEEDGILPVEISLLLFNTQAIWCNQGLKSIERDMGVNHESRSVFDGFKVWGTNQGFSITYQADYTFHDVFISGKDPSTSLGMYLWKHSHNHVFDNIKFVDLEYGITVSKLVESGNGNHKTRNNGFTQWFFLDLDTVNIGKFYEIIPEDYNSNVVYTEHGDNPIHLPSNVFSPRPTTFSILDSSNMYVDLATEKLRFTIDGIVTDQMSSYHFGIEQAAAQGDLRLDYPERIYEFASVQKLEEYVSNNGLYKEPDTEKLYFVINELVPDRLTAKYTAFPMRIRVDNAPSTGVWANAQIEDVSDNAEPLQIVSRWATVSQSSTAEDVMYQDSLIDCGPHKAIDGNTNGRVSVNYLQQGLVPIGSFSQTNVELEPWYDLDLGEKMDIEYLDIWNTVELNGYKIENVSSHFENFYVLIADEPFGDMSLADAKNHAHYMFKMDAPLSRVFKLENMGQEGRYIRIQGEGTTMIKHAEVEVVGRRQNKECSTIVSTTDDDGFGSLRAAIACAVDGDTITFAEGVFGQEILLSSAPLEVDKSITISSDLLAEDVSVVSEIPMNINLPCIFDVTDAAQSLSLIGFSVKGGASNDGAVIKNAGSVILDNMILSNAVNTNPISTVLNMGSGNITVRNEVLLLKD